MALITYLLELTVTLGADSTGTLQYTVPNNESMELMKLVHTSQGTFDITDIQTGSGKSHTNAGANNGIPNTHLQDAVNAFRAIMEFPKPIVLSGGDTLTIDLLDTSSAGNVVNFTFVGVRDTG